MAEDLKHKAVKGVLWQLVEVGGRQMISFVISVILARLIMPDQFGMIAMLAVFTGVSDVLIYAGFPSALIRKNECTQADYSSVYWVNILIAVICYIILFFCAPLIATFYEMSEISAILRVSAIGLIIGSLSGVHHTILRKDINFKRIAKYNLIGLIISGSVGVFLAFMDFEVWALVIQGLTMTISTTVCLLTGVKWRPSFIISKASLKELFGFSSKLMLTGLIDSLYCNMYSIVIGKVFKASDLAFYNRAQNLMSMTSSLPTSVLHSVTFPTLSKINEDDVRLKNAYRRTIKLAAFIVFPLCLGVGAVAYPLINVLYTEKWIFSATLLSIIVFGGMWYPIHAINLNYLMVKGRSDLALRLEVIKKIQGIAILCATLPFGLVAMCYGNIVGSVLCLLWNTYYTGKFLKMNIFRQLRDMAHIIALCSVMYCSSKFVTVMLGNDLLSLVCGVVTGLTIYVGGALIFRFPEVAELKNLK